MRRSAAVAGAAVGDPHGDVLMGPLLHAKFAERYEEYLTWLQPHHRVLGAQGRITADNPRAGFVGDPAAGLFYHPVVVDGVRPGDRVFEEETFGPLVGVTTYETLTEAIDLANAPGYGLSSSIYTSDPSEAFAFRDRIGAGTVVGDDPFEPGAASRGLRPSRPVVARGQAGPGQGRHRQAEQQART